MTARTHVLALFMAASAAIAITGLSPAAAAPPGGTTTITVKVIGCDGCTVRPFAALQVQSGDQPYVDWHGKKQAVRNGVVRFTIPTAYTDGMSLQVTAPWETGSAGYVPMAALSKKGYCWRGTSNASARIRLIVKKKSVQGMGGPAVIPNAYLSSLRQPKSPPGHQDLPYCVVPR